MNIQFGNIGVCVGGYTKESFHLWEDSTVFENSIQKKEIKQLTINQKYNFFLNKR